MSHFRYCTLIAAMLFVASPADAQFSVGVLAGANMANLDFKTDGGDLSTETLTGFMGGLVFDYAIGSNVAISVQPTYMGKGAKATAGDIDPEFSGNAEINLTYIELPILFRYSFGTGNIKPFVEAGPSIGFLSKAEWQVGEKTEDIQETVKSTDFSGSFGAGIDLGVGNFTAFAGARYSMGLSDIIDQTDGTEEVKTKGVQVLVGFKVPLGGK
jgi:opacity protein-like surface antigen